MKYILGSGSPRRKDLFGRLCSVFRIISPDIDERCMDGEQPEKFAERMSAEKMQAVFAAADEFSTGSEDIMAVTADTIVTIDGKIIGKPADCRDAVSILSMLSGRTHKVITGITFFFRQNGQEIMMTDHDETAVTFKSLSEKGIAEYLAASEWRDKAGAYAIQENREMIIESAEGSESNVTGFPLEKFASMALAAGAAEYLDLKNVPGRNHS